MMQRVSRLAREVERLASEPPPGVSCWLCDEASGELRAQILGGAGTPYEEGIFSLEVQIPDRYPFEPPKVTFLTPIYHPNIDTAGRICLDILKMPPKGAWRPSLNVSTVLTSVQQLMGEPNPDDPLMPDISAEFKYNKPAFVSTAKSWTRKHAMAEKVSPDVEKATGGDIDWAPQKAVPLLRDDKKQPSEDEAGHHEAKRVRL
ncbi:ubiquitin-conjugating enzyme E2 T isoform X1 [Lampetra planeri]